MRARLFADENRKWWTLAAVAFGLFMIMLDNTVVNVALPSIQRDLGVGLSELEWIVSGYALSFAALMLIGGKLADAYGRRLVFVVGIAVFTLASLACGLASSGDVLIAARIAQGVGAAMMNPATLSIIAVTFPPRERGTAIGIWAGTSALALAIGPLVGRAWTQAGIFGVAPDPTAVATLGVALMADRVAWNIVVVPLVWCVVSGATLWTMASPDAFVMLPVALLGLGLVAWKAWACRPDRAADTAQV